MHKTDADALAEIERRVRRELYQGFYDPDEVAIIIPEDYGDAMPVDAATLRAVIDRVQAEMATWPEVTDCDRLDAAFDALEDGGILCMQNAGYTQSNGIEDCVEAYQDAGGDESDYVGYCFYHGQDLERVMAGGDLDLNYGHWREEERGVEIGERICAAMREQGFEVEWDGSLQRQVSVKGVRWQRKG